MDRFRFTKKVTNGRCPFAPFSVNFSLASGNDLSLWIPIPLRRCVTSLAVWQRIDQRGLPVGHVHYEARSVQGTSKERFLGCVKKFSFVYLLQAGERNFFTPYSHKLGSIL